MKTQWIKTTGTVLLAMMMVAGIDAQPRGGRGLGPCGQGSGPYGQGKQAPGYGYGRNQNCMLDLTDEQFEQIKAFRLDHYKVMNPLKNKMAELKASERTLFSEADVDMKALNKVIDDQTSLTNQMKKLQAEHRVATRGILTEEQLMKLDQRQNFAGRRNAGRYGAGRYGAGRQGNAGRGYHRNVDW